MMYIAKVYIKSDDIKKHLPEEYKDCDMLIMNSTIQNYGKDIELECVIAPSIIDTRKDVRYKIDLIN